jgi:hypothetical protein
MKQYLLLRCLDELRLLLLCHGLLLTVSFCLSSSPSASAPVCHRFSNTFRGRDVSASIKVHQAILALHNLQPLLRLDSSSSLQRVQQEHINVLLANVDAATAEIQQLQDIAEAHNTRASMYLDRITGLPAQLGSSYQ